MENNLERSLKTISAEDLNGNLKKQENKYFECKFCPLEFLLQTEVKKHILNVHPEKKSYFCEFCESKFSKKYNVQRHIKNIHMKDKNKNSIESPKAKEVLKCGVCMLPFRSQIYLNIHQSTHKESYTLKEIMQNMTNQ